MRVGRRRTKNQHLPQGVRPIGARLFWQPSTARERSERRAKGLPASAALGPIVRVAGRIELTKQQRLVWAELSGYRDAQAAGTVGELLTLFNSGERPAILTKWNGKPRSPNTVKQYRGYLPTLHAHFGRMSYGRTATEVAAGKGVNAGQIQAFITASGSFGKAYLAILTGAFRNGVLENLTTYNPCRDVKALEGNPRTREPQEWEMEVIGTMAPPVIGLILETKLISGYRISEIIGRHRRDMNADGIRFKTKGGKRETAVWSPRLREIIAAAEQLPKASKFPASALFPNSRGHAYSYKGWYAAWRELVATTNRALEATLDVEDLEPWHPALAITDLVVHDLRSKVHDDAEAMGREGHEQLGNTERVADRHYSRREKRRRMLA